MEGKPYGFPSMKKTQEGSAPAFIVGENSVVRPHQAMHMLAMMSPVMVSAPPMVCPSGLKSQFQRNVS